MLSVWSTNMLSSLPFHFTTKFSVPCTYVVRKETNRTRPYIFKALWKSGELLSLHPVHRRSIMKTSFSIALTTVIAHATPTIWSMSTLTLCATIIMMGD